MQRSFRLFLLTLVFLTVSARAETPPPATWQVYIGTYTSGPSEGIYLLDLDTGTGELSNLRLAGATANPSFLTLHPKLPILYSVGESGGPEGGRITAFSISGDGTLTALNSRPTVGEGPCHVAVDPAGRHVAMANYGGGSVTVFALGEDGSLGSQTSFVQHQGSSVNPGRQEGPHAHCVNFDPSGRFLLVADLGIDRVMVYRLDPETGVLTPNDPPSAELAPGAGPRHLAFDPTGKFVYVINELDSTITAFSYDPENGRLKNLETVSTLPRDFKGENTTAEIFVHPNGRSLYGSNRGADSIASFQVAPETGILLPLEHTPTGGSTPRNFNIDPSGNLLLAANQKSDSIVVFRVDPGTGSLKPTGSSVEVPSPVCVIFRKAE